MKPDARQLSVMAAAARGRVTVDVTGRISIRGQEHAVTGLVRSLIRAGVLWQEYPPCGCAAAGAFVRTTRVGDWWLRHAFAD